MQTTHLESICNNTHQIPIEAWAEATLVAYVRVKSNDGHRSPRQEKTRRKNFLDDTIGSLAEILCLDLLEAKYPELKPFIDDKRVEMFHDKCGYNTPGADFQFPGHAADMKSLDLSPNKKMFCINEPKHLKLKGQCDWYLCVLAPIVYPHKRKVDPENAFVPTGFGRTASITRLIEWREVDDWERWQWYHGGWSKYMDLDEFVPKYAPETPELDELRQSTYPAQDVKDLACEESFRAKFAAKYTNLSSYVTRTSDIQAQPRPPRRGPWL